MNASVKFDEDRSAALRALLIETARADASPRASHVKRPVRRRAVLLIAVGVVLGVAGTGGAVGVLNGLGSLSASGAGFPQPVTTNELTALGVVLQRGDAQPELCLGAVAQSLPPVCTGPAIHGWDWASVEQEETARGVTWGSYVVYGTWDGVDFTVTRDPIPFSSSAPIPDADPRLDEQEPGASDEAKLLSVRRDLLASDYPTLMVDGPLNGYMFIGVIYDDGTVQAFVDKKYGPGVVVVLSALRPAV